jgi:hypothetical protein
LTPARRSESYTADRFEDFLPDLEILKPPEEPGRNAGLFFSPTRRYTAGHPPERPSAIDMLGTIALWLWRLVNTALLAAGVWLLFSHVAALEALNGELQEVIDYLNVIAERLG